MSLSTTPDGTGSALAYLETSHTYRVTPMSEARKRIEQAGIEFAKRKKEREEPEQKKSPENLKDRAIRDWLEIATPDPIVPDIEGYEPDAPKPPKISEIKKDVAERRGVSVIDLESQRRSHKISHARFEAMWMARHLTTRSFPEIGREFGDRDHTTVLHAVGRYTKMLQTGQASYPPGWDHSITIDFKPLEYTENRRAHLQVIYDAFIDAHERETGTRVYIRPLGNAWVAVEKNGEILFKARKEKLIELTEQYNSTPKD